MATLFFKLVFALIVAGVLYFMVDRIPMNSVVRLLLNGVLILGLLFWLYNTFILSGIIPSLF